MHSQSQESSLVKAGDLIVKDQGNFDFGKTGLVLRVEVNSAGYKFVKVLVDRSVKNWWAEYVSVIYER